MPSLSLTRRSRPNIVAFAGGTSVETSGGANEIDQVSRSHQLTGATLPHSVIGPNGKQWQAYEPAVALLVLLGIQVGQGFGPTSNSKGVLMASLISFLTTPEESRTHPFL